MSPPRTCRSVVLPDPEAPPQRNGLPGLDREVDVAERGTPARPRRRTGQRRLGTPPAASPSSWRRSPDGPPVADLDDPVRSPSHDVGVTDDHDGRAEVASQPGRSRRGPRARCMCRARRSARRPAPAAPRAPPRRRWPPAAARRRTGRGPMAVAPRQAEVRPARSAPESWPRRGRPASVRRERSPRPRARTRLSDWKTWRGCAPGSARAGSGERAEGIAERDEPHPRRRSRAAGEREECALP